MNYTTTIASVLGITAAGFISVWVCDRFVKRRKQTKKMSIVFDDVVNDMETAILLQTAISQKRTRTRITSGMIRKWNMMAKKGTSHKQIAAEYGVSLVSVDRYLARSGRKKTGKYPKAIIPVALYGMPYDCEKIMAIANKYNIPVIEDAAEGMGSRFNGRVLGTFGRFGVLSFNGNKMITTSGGGALICQNGEDANNVMWHATQARDAYPYYQHTEIGYNYRMSNVCAGIGRGQMTVLDAHIAHHKHVQALYEELLEDVSEVHIHKQPSDSRYDANFWLCAATLDPEVKIQGQENAYKEAIKTAVGGAAGVIKAVDCATTDCQPNDNVEALRVFMLNKKVECRPVWKPMHKQPVYADAVAYINGVSEEIFKVGFCLPAGPYVTDDDVHYIVDCIKEAIVR